jgi:hypothetical protein
MLHVFLRSAGRAGALLAVLLLGSIPAIAAAPTDPGTKAAVAGQPFALMVQPDTIVLRGSRAVQQVVVSGLYSDGPARDLTQFSDYTLDGDVATADSGGFLRAKHNGDATLIVRAGGQSARVLVSVRDTDRPDPVSFRRDVIAALNVGGCNSGACHGTPTGKAGFRLSLRGFDPAVDFLQLTRDVFGRRTTGLDPDASLILQKALGRVPHEGGQRFHADSRPAQMIHTWLAEGRRDDPKDLPALLTTQILPGPRLLRQPARWQQLAVLARFTDGSVQDVTRQTVFTSSDENVASVDANGLVEFRQSGEVAILCRYLMELQPVRLTYLEPREGFAWSNPLENNYVDHHVFAKLKLLSIPPSDLCSDAEFLRRAYLDLCGILPTPNEVTAFLASADKDKRAKMIDTLLNRPEYADFWTMKWLDVLRSQRKTIEPKGVYVYQQWLRDQIAENVPFDQVVRELLTASGSTFANPPANYYRVTKDPQNLAESTAQLFFGIRMQCAKCHNHPFERWTQDDYYSLAAFFARVKLKKDPAQPGDPNNRQSGAEVVYEDRAGEVVQPRTGKTMVPRVMGLTAPTLAPGKERRDVLAEMVTSPSNPYFARSIVNRIWFHLNGRGIVDPVDDFRDSNPSANDDLLDALTHDFVAHHFDVRYLIRVIMASRTYQLSADTNALNKNDAKYFSHAVTKLLTAEQMLDALCLATDVPEKFKGMPDGTRAAQLPDGEFNHAFLKTFGQPARELACECEREADSNLAQALQLINGPTVNEKLRKTDNRVGKALARKLSDMDTLNELYLATLSRPAAADEAKPLLEHVLQAKDKRKAWEDVHWALINSKEFLFRH